MGQWCCIQVVSICLPRSGLLWSRQTTEWAEHLPDAAQPPPPPPSSPPAPSQAPGAPESQAGARPMGSPPGDELVLLKVLPCC